MYNQFFYYNQTTKGISSFNLERITHTISSPAGKAVVILNDFHNDLRDFQIPKKNGGQSVETHVIDVCSEISLNEVDTQRLMDVLGCDRSLADYPQPAVSAEALDAIRKDFESELGTFQVTEEQALAGAESSSGI